MIAAPRIAIVSDPLVQRGGAERVVEALAGAFPDAPIFAILYSASSGPRALQSRITGSWLNKVPMARQRHRWFLPLYRHAIESLDLSAFDVIISSHHAVAKGVLTRSDQVHICYCHTPMRALWERTSAELETLPAAARPIAAAIFSSLREWDVVSASRVQTFIANSSTTQRRIATYYRRSSTIVFPPIATDFFTPGGNSEDYFLVASRPVPYKRVDIAIAATAAMGVRLKVVGGKHSLKDAPSNVDLLGAVSDEELRMLMRGARALIFPQLEDFGMTPLEMNACGRPVIAYGNGGALDTIIDGETGVFAYEQNARSFIEAIERFQHLSFNVDRLRAHSLKFSSTAFVGRMRSLIGEAWTRRLELPLQDASSLSDS